VCSFVSNIIIVLLLVVLVVVVVRLVWWYSLDDVSWFCGGDMIIFMLNCMLRGLDSLGRL